jgi:hypothetical protein
VQTKPLAEDGRQPVESFLVLFFKKELLPYAAEALK